MSDRVRCNWKRLEGLADPVASGFFEEDLCAVWYGADRMIDCQRFGTYCTIPVDENDETRLAMRTRPLRAPLDLCLVTCRRDACVRA